MTWDGTNRRKVTNADQAHILFMLENNKIERLEREVAQVKERIAEIKQFIQGEKNGTN